MKVLEMIFTNQQGKNVTIRVREPKEGLTKAEVDAVMNLIVTKNIFTSNGGDLVAVKGSRIVDRIVTEF
ncbi:MULTISPECIES: DUF2922 domain-containing protein [Carboxydothermus]|uniref:DUF2922 domain-containing protein n=3 Tax=Carboxydothermus TaxID=129957 RepID=Q3AFR7_CARHZ|nr:MULTISPECIES: DUF2922 domain-containing protein [Carboxydothermus]ABB14872.1 conserved hypothetical protein [Carboxydothermus hydrogenoformans Z-2901]NYE57437.1 hypothetical protein [Carboxydothermus ferrireducens DSM 11255]GAV25281.1 hypothetical protein ciss_12140 [Carboxydothermus islandicus]